MPIGFCIAGNTDIIVRDVPHGGVKVVGDKALRLLTVHIVDKGKPLYDIQNKRRANKRSYERHADAFLRGSMSDARKRFCKKRDASGRV